MNSIIKTSEQQKPVVDVRPQISQMDFNILKSTKGA